MFVRVYTKWLEWIVVCAKPDSLTRAQDQRSLLAGFTVPSHPTGDAYAGACRGHGSRKRHACSLRDQLST